MVAAELKDAIAAKEFPKLLQIMRKPIFGFLEIEIVKLLKRFATNPPAHILAGCKILNSSTVISRSPS